MIRLSLKSTAILAALVLTLASVGCSKRVPPPVAAPPIPPPPPPPTPTVTLTADRTAINAGQAVTLSYTATNAATVTIQPGIGAVQPATNGTRQVNPTALTTYTATATGPGGTATSAGITVSVAAAQPPQPPPPAPTPVATNTAPPPRPATPTLDEIFRQTILPILFDYDKATIRADQESKLLNAAAWLKMNAAVRFSIEGHADERGSQEYNIALGDERAAAVKKYLTGQGIADARMNTVSYGEERPACRVESEACWQENRRASFARLP